MKFWFLFFIALISTQITAQSPDSIAIKQIDSLLRLSMEFTDKSEYDKALEINIAAEQIALEKFGRESSEYGYCCHNRGRVNYFNNNYVEAEKSYLEAIAIHEKVSGKEHRNYASSLNNLALLYKEIGNYQKAEPLYLEAKAIREKVFGKSHPEYAESLMNLATFYSNFGKYQKAESFFLEGITIWENVNGKEHENYAGCLQNLGVLYDQMGYYEKIEPLYLEAKDIYLKAIGKNHPQYTQVVTNLAIYYVKIGIYENAEKYFLEAKTIREKIGKISAAYCGTIINIGAFYVQFGNFSKAEQLFLEAKEIFEQRLNIRIHPFYLICLTNLSNLYVHLGNFQEAEHLNLEVIANLEKQLGKDHPDYAEQLSSLAILYNAMGKYEKAEPLLLEAKSVQEKALGKDHPYYANNLNILASLYMEIGNYQKAEPLFIESKTILEKALGKEDPNYAIILSGLAHMYERENRFFLSEPLLLEKFVLDQNRLSKAVSFLSERELSTYMDMFKRFGDDLGSYLIARLRFGKNGVQSGHLGILPILAFDQALYYKGFLLTAATQLNSSTELSPEIKEINLLLKSYRRQLAAEYAKPIAEQKNVVELEEKANTAEKELARSIAGYAEVKRQVKWEEVMSALKKDEAAIEFVSFKVNFPKMADSIMYAALLLKPGTKQPIFITLFEEKQLDSLLKTSGERKADYVNGLYTLADRGAMAIEAPKKSLYELIWKPMEEELVGVKKIYFSPSGLLHRINLDAIPVSQIETLADKFQLIEVNSTRQLVIPKQKNIANQDAVLIGGIQYEQDNTFQNNEPILVSRSRGELSFSSVDSTLRGGSWNPLAWTEWEVNSIEKIMQAAGVAVSLKKGYAATEESFKNIGTNNSPSPRILHVATHGYFFPDVKQKNKESTLISQSEPVFKISEHPMLRSGLIMAGGNATWQGKQTLEGRDDGILTAYEISQMNLSNTELVVLSACETGLGDIQGNEGVYGLQRAFKIAGAKYLIMSLWQVPDKQTSLLMTTFYKKWLQEKMSIPDAFHAAQKELRDNGLDPYNWAGFVLVE